MEKKSVVKKAVKKEAVKKKALARPSRTMSVDELYRRVLESDARYEKLREESDERWKIFDGQIQKMSLAINKIGLEQYKLRKRESYIQDTFDRLDDEYDKANCLESYPERFFQDALAELDVIRFGNEEYEGIRPNVRCDSRTKGKIAIDIVLVNEESVVLIDADYEVRPESVKELAEEKAVKYRQFFPLLKDRTIYLGMAGFSFCKQVLIDAQKYGIGIIRQVGEGVEMEMGNLKAY